MVGDPTGGKPWWELSVTSAAEPEAKSARAGILAQRRSGAESTSSGLANPFRFLRPGADPSGSRLDNGEALCHKEHASSPKVIGIRGAFGHRTGRMSFKGAGGWVAVAGIAWFIAFLAGRAGLSNDHAAASEPALASLPSPGASATPDSSTWPQLATTEAELRSAPTGKPLTNARAALASVVAQALTVVRMMSSRPGPGS